MLRCGCIAKPILALLLLASTIVLATESPLVSNGTCYYAAGKTADDVYIPCGNDAFEVYACCMNGDTCLSSNACYNSQYGDTYIAGCTDPTYSGTACGNKGAYDDQQWTSLVRCYVSNDTNARDEQWAPCFESHQPIVTQHDGGCTCTASASTAVFTDYPTLLNEAVLPTATGLTISYYPGYTPPSDLTPTAPIQSSTSSASSTSSSSSTTSTPSTISGIAAASTSSPTSTSTPTPTPSPHGLSTAAEAGIGVGAGLGVLLICAILFLLYRRRVKQRDTSIHPSNQPFMSPYTDNSEGWTPPSQAQRFSKQGAVGRSAEMSSPAFFGHKSELPAEERSALMGSSQSPSTMALNSSVSEVEGTYMTGTSYTGIGRLSPAFTPSSGGTRTSSTNQGSYVPARTSANIQDVHELPETPY